VRCFCARCESADEVDALLKESILRIQGATGYLRKTVDQMERSLEILQRSCQDNERMKNHLPHHRRFPSISGCLRVPDYRQSDQPATGTAPQSQIFSTMNHATYDESLTSRLSGAGLVQWLCGDGRR
jgi:hypothetical protein